jgi:hypothetical protein
VLALPATSLRGDLVMVPWLIRGRRAPFLAS